MLKASQFAGLFNDITHKQNLIKNATVIYRGMFKC